MGPRSREHICNVLGHLIDELQLQRGAVESLPARMTNTVMEKVREEQEGDLKKVNDRIGVLERFLRGAKPSPA
jgi:hypothetical protein